MNATSWREVKRKIGWSESRSCSFSNRKSKKGYSSGCSTPCGAIWNLENGLDFLVKRCQLMK